MQNSNIEKKIKECQENENLDKLTLKDLLIKYVYFNLLLNVRYKFSKLYITFYIIYL